MNKSLKISLITLGVLGTGIGLYFLLKPSKARKDENYSDDDNIFEKIIKKFTSSSFPLKNGSGGDRVKALQIFLNTSGSYGLIVDGKFGPATETALKGEQAPFSQFKAMYPDAVNGQVTEGYYNMFIKQYENFETLQASIVNSEEQGSIVNIVPTGGGYTGLQYAIDPLSFDGSRY